MVVLPAVSWAEENGTFTNCERRVQRAPKAFTNPDSNAASDWMIIAHLAHMMEAKWQYESEMSVLEEITQVVPIYAGLTWDALGDQGLQWDAASVRSEASYQPAEQMELSASDAHPYTLVTGTVTYDGGTMFGLTGQMSDIAYGPIVGMNSTDAASLNLEDSAEVTVRSSHGELALQLVINDRIQAGTVWIPESLPGAPVGSLLNGSSVENVAVTAR